MQDCSCKELQFDRVKIDCEIDNTRVIYEAV